MTSTEALAIAVEILRFEERSHRFYTQDMIDDCLVTLESLLALLQQNSSVIVN